MFERNPHYKLFNKACKYWDNASKGEKIDADGYHDDYDAALFQFDKLLILIQEEGDILKPKPVRGGDSGLIRYSWFDGYFDNLTQKVHFFKSSILAERGLGRYFKEAMLEMDKAIQANPENTDVWINKINLFNSYIQANYHGKHPALWAEIIKSCDKVLSIKNGSTLRNLSVNDNHLVALNWKQYAAGEVERWEDMIESLKNILRFDDQENPDKPITNHPIAITRISALMLISEASHHLGRLSEAKKYLLEVKRLDPYNDIALEYLHELGDQIPDDVVPEKINTSSREMSSSCEKCGTTLKPTAKFCGKCGTPRT
jgi:tetratricopeptide (TPR) repeat protein